MLSEAGIFPSRLAKAKNLLESLISEEKTVKNDLFGSDSDLFGDEPAVNPAAPEVPPYYFDHSTIFLLIFGNRVKNSVIV